MSFVNFDIRQIARRRGAFIRLQLMCGLLSSVHGTIFAGSKRSGLSGFLANDAVNRTAFWFNSKGIAVPQVIFNTAEIFMYIWLNCIFAILTFGYQRNEVRS